MAPLHSDCAILTCDARQLPYALAVARRIAAVEPERRFDVAVASPAIEVARTSPGGSVRLLPLDVSRLPPITHPNPRIGMGTFYRHLLPRALSGQYRALFYMDTDTWLRRPGLQGLFDRLPAGVAIAGVPDFQYRLDLEDAPRVRDPENRARLATFGGPAGEYVQSGALMIGVERYLELGLDERILGWAAAHEDLLHAHRIGEQAALNAVAAGEIALLDPRWNWHKLRFLRAEMVERFDPFLLHFAGHSKPWLIQDNAFVATFNAAFWSLLREDDPGYEPALRPRSLAWYRQHPRYGIPPLDAVQRWLRRRRDGRQLAAAAPTPRAIAAMDALIAAAEVA